MKCDKSRKTHLITMIQLIRLRLMGIEDVKKSTNGYRRKTVAELEEIYKEEMNEEV